MQDVSVGDRQMGGRMSGSSGAARGGREPGLKKEDLSQRYGTVVSPEARQQGQNQSSFTRKKKMKEI